MSIDARTYIKVGIITFASAITFLVQTYLLPDAGKNEVSKFSEYSFQLDIWSEKIHEKFEFIKYSNSYKSLSLNTGQKTVNKEFFEHIDEYHFQIMGMLRVLNRHAGVAVNIMNDSEPLLSKAGDELGLEKLQSIKKDYEDFYKNLNKYKEKINTIESYMPKLTDAFTYQGANLSDDDKIELTVKQIELLRLLYSSEDLFLKHGSNPFEFVRDFASASDKILLDYRKINNAYNQAVSQEKVIKNSVILFVIFIAAYFTFRKETQI